MINDCEKIQKQLVTTLEILEVEIDDVLKRAEKGIEISKETLKKIRNIVVDNQFKTKQDEIYFFKKIKPKVYSRLIYYVKLFCIENRRPKSSTKNQIKFLSNEVNKLQEYFNHNLDFCLYYRRNSTVFDKQYFLRGQEDIRLFPDTYHFYTDDEFSTSHDTSVATIQAYDMLIVYIKKEIDKLENNGYHLIQQQKQGNIVWTGNKTDLIELVYALYASGSVNKGTAEIKDIARIAERIFKVDLGNYYHTFIEIKSRKINQTKYLDKLKTSFLDYIEKSDE
ncbi:RteC domain-containing protein [uncultured Tenacibaculum sp.]|uniref:RteC domain-containing protein n=1 Tax=uncultured Tenacibaculum sp. TaxID=174713 RepID=UPI002634E250|nr:RteC domain-containing protein [uncultured Tenacibaculum sp.]